MSANMGWVGTHPHSGSYDATETSFAADNAEFLLGNASHGSPITPPDYEHQSNAKLPPSFDYQYSQTGYDETQVPYSTIDDARNSNNNVTNNNLPPSTHRWPTDAQDSSALETDKAQYFQTGTNERHEDGTSYGLWKPRTTGIPLDAVSLCQDSLCQNGEREVHDTSKDWGESPPRPTGQKLRMVKLWAVETIAIIVSAGLLIAIYSVLGAFNGKRTSDWRAPINLTTLVATLSTISRIALVAVASEVISQSKWSRFWRSASQPRKAGRPLEELQSFDQASRGPWGSILLLRNSLRKPTLLLTLIVVLTSVAMGPFTQQAVQTIECRFTDSTQTATIPTINTLGDIRPGRWSYETDSQEGDRISYAIKAAIISSLTDPNAADSSIQATCTTGNCTFPLLQDSNGLQITHSSIGFCSRCFDVSSDITHNSTIYPVGENVHVRNRTSWYLPNGQQAYHEHILEHTADGWLDHYTQNTLDISTGGLDSFPSLQEGDHHLTDEAARFLNLTQYALLNIIFLSVESAASEYVPQFENGAATATACTLYQCVKSYNASITGTNLTESLVSSEQLTPYGDSFPIINRVGTTDLLYKYVFPADMISVRTPCLVRDQIYTEANLTSAPGATTLSLLVFNTNASSLTYNAYTNTGTLVDIAGTKVNVTSTVVNITAPPECLYATEHFTWFKNLQEFLANTVSAHCGSWSQSQSRMCLSGSTRDSDTDYTSVMDPFWMEGLAQRNKTLGDNTQYMEDFAESLTRKFRMGLYETTSPFNISGVHGSAWQTTTCFAVDWRWLLFPSALTLISAGVLIWTVFRYAGGRADGEMVWKSSILPLLYYRERIVEVGPDGTSAPDREYSVPLVEANELQKDAKRVKVVFHA